MATKKINIDKTWTLFLDRDGVINHQNMNGYILKWDDFLFYDDVLQAMQIVAHQFQHICIVTNQRGVGKGVMELNDLTNIHLNMQSSIEKAGGKIDQIYFCTEVDADSPGRKPNTGMAFQAQLDFPSIDFKKSIMVGNSISDMEFGRNIGAKTVFLSTTNKEINALDERIDYLYTSLIEFANAI